MSEVGDCYIGADILLHKGDKMARDYEVVQSCNTIGNIIGRAHTNLILDTRMYQAEFSGGEVMELTTNVTAKSMYT